ncbi:hypothetical protein C8A03DRAFT_34222 [Achaetomium macrosporum]|uniref:BTB domain-containing protein n=1 Tax=Achaetomium macrosporum TaxID=79813 RepID=A0AAN7C9S9_9PEZI|nr:hypothetical protein C8A03DRAFT_34222 [Achaetomium macrosporum]
MDATHATEMVRLDENGDVVLAVRNGELSKTRHFLVSTAALSLTSPIFAKMFSPNFREGRLVREARESSHPLPVINLDEDDVEAMDFILSNLHPTATRIPRCHTAKDIALVAVTAEKYDCRAALMPWLRREVIRTMDHIRITLLKALELLVTAEPQHNHSRGDTHPREYIHALKKANIWPTFHRLENLSVNDMVAVVEGLQCHILNKECLRLGPNG